MMELVGLSRSFGGKAALADVSLTVQDDEYLTLLGPSGAGKSTLLRLIAGLEQPDAGRIVLNGQDITALPTHLRALGFVQQNYALFPHMNVFDNVAFGLRHRLSNPVGDEAELRRRVERMLSLVGLEGLGSRMVGQISGGQKQRVSLARTLVTEPRICLLDEPLGALDANLRERMTVELRSIRATLGVTFLHVTGNETEALAMGDRMIVLDRGRLLQLAPPADVYARPAQVQVARFLNAYNVLSGETREGAFHSGRDRLVQPDPAAQAGAYAVRYDRVRIDDGPAGEPGLEAAYVATEFLGSRLIHFFRRDDDSMIEVERHLSHHRPAEYRTGERHRLSWSASDVILFDRGGARIDPETPRRAA